MPLAEGGTPDPNAIPTGPAIKGGEPPPLTITLPEGWKAVHILVPFRSVNSIRDVPLSIYTGPLPGGVTGYIYLFWGFPNVVTPGGELNLWADGLQILRGALVDQSCNLGIDRTQHLYRVGGREAVGTTYTAVACEGETDTAGYPDYGAIVGGVASHWDEATGDIIVRAVVGWGGRGARGDSDRNASRLLGELLRSILASRFSLGMTQVERPVPAAGRGGLVCAHCGFSSAHERAFYCPKCGMRLLRG